MSESPAIALFGGAFNPPHRGHAGVVRHVLVVHPGPLWILPAYVHAFGKPLAPFEHRVRMCELAFTAAGAGTPATSAGDASVRVVVSRVEADVPGRTGYSIDTLRYLVARHPEASFRLVLGADLLHERARWKSFDEVERLAPPLWVPRRGFEEANRALGLDPFLDDVRSVDVRARIARGEDVSALVGPAVARYVREHHLYEAGDR